MRKYLSYISLLSLLASLILVGFAWAADEPEKQNSEGVQTEEDATTSGNNLPERVTPNLFKQREQDIEKYLTSVQREDELVDIPSSGESFFGFLLLERTGKPQGGVLILPDNGQHGHWPRIVAPLREYLPDYGWQTLTISLPDVPMSRLKRTDYSEQLADNPDEDSDEVEAGDADQNGIDINSPIGAKKTSFVQGEYYAKQMPERINSAYNHLNQSGQLNVVIIASGHSATWAANWLASQNVSEENKRGFTLVIIDALEDAYAPVKLAPTLSQLDFPILDIITPSNHNNALTNKKRLGVMKREKRTGYQQIHLNSFNFSADYSNEINRTVRGWLSKNAAGMEGKVVDAN